MKKTVLDIEGMACSMCEAHVNEAIRKAFDVKKVTSSHKKNETVIISDNELDEGTLRNVIGETGYSLNGIKIEDYEKKGLFSFK